MAYPVQSTVMYDLKLTLFSILSQVAVGGRGEFVSGHTHPTVAVRR